MTKAPTDNTPESPDAERAVLGAMMMAGEAVVAVQGILKSDHFHVPGHRKIYTAMLALAKRDEPIDMATVTSELEKTGGLDAVGGAGAILDIADSVYTVANAPAHAQIVLEKAVLRQLIGMGDALVLSCRDHPGQVETLIEDTQSRLLRISAEAQYGQTKSRRWDTVSVDVSSQLDLNQAAHREHGKIGLARTGLSDLDRRIGGFRAGQLVIIGGRTGQGKTALATSMALYMAYVESVPVAMFSLEMTDIDIGIRMVCAEAGVSVFRAMTGQLNPDEFARISDTQANLHAMPFHIDKTANLTLAAFIARCHELCADHGVKVIILDYLQLMRGPKEAQNREQEVAAISRACKQVALSQKVVVIALSQLSREADKHGRDSNKLPVLTDLRESGALEQDADVVLFPWRKMNLNDDGHEIRQAAPIEAKIKIAKLRNGQCGVVPCWFNPEPMTFSGVAPEPREGYADGR